MLDSDNYRLLGWGFGEVERWGVAELSLSGPGKHARQGITFVGVEQLLAVGAKPGNPRHCTLHDCRCYKIRLLREREKERE